MSEQVIQIQTGATAANNEIDLSGHIPSPMDTRAGNDPVIEAEYQDEDTAGGGSDLTSIGQGAVGDPAAGEIAVVSDTSVALGDALAAGDVLVISYDPSGEGGIKS